jgi:hypothetical protein
MTLLDTTKWRALWSAVDAATTSHEKGRAFEDLIAWLFEQVPGVVVTARDELTVSGDQEVDVAFWNDQHSDGLRQFDPIILVECKNWGSAVSAHEVGWFLHKLRERGRPFGILVAANGITGDPGLLNQAQQVVAAALREARELLVLTRDEIESLADTNELVLLLKSKRARLAVSGGAL